MQPYPIAVTVAGVLLATVVYLWPTISTALVSLWRKVPAAPVVLAPVVADPADLLVDAGRLWIAQGRGDLAQAAFDLAVKSAKGAE